MLDIDAIRAETPGCSQVVHLNNAGSSLPPRRVVDAMVDWLRDEELQGGYEVARNRVNDLAAFHSTTAVMLGCDPSEVAFTPSAADGWWRAFMSVPIEPGERILVNRSEFQANAFGWLRARDLGAIIDVVPNDADGMVDLDALDSLLGDDVALVSMTMISMSNGAVQPVAEVGHLVAPHRAIYLLDACQAAGQLPLSVSEIGCDFLSYTGRKFMRGPRGTGALFARETVMDRLSPPVFVDGHAAVWTGEMTWEANADATRFEFGEIPYAGKAALAVATQYVLDLGLDAIAERIQMLADTLRSRLAETSGVEVLDEGTEQCGIVTFAVEGHDCLELQQQLEAEGINLSAPGQGNAQLDIGSRGLASVLRAGVHYYNTVDELDRLVNSLPA